MQINFSKLKEVFEMPLQSQKKYYKIVSVIVMKIKKLRNFYIFLKTHILLIIPNQQALSTCHLFLGSILSTSHFVRERAKPKYVSVPMIFL